MSDVGADTMIGVPDSQDAWHREAGEVAAELGTDLSRGLSAAEAARRLARFGPNGSRRRSECRRGGSSSASSQTR